MINNSCKCPYYCKNHGLCDNCLKNKKDCFSSSTTYCGKERIPKKPQIMKTPVWATADEKKGINQPVLENTIKLDKKRYGNNYYNNYDLKFNENGQLLICDYRIYDTDNGIVIKEIKLKTYQNREFYEKRISNSDIISYHEGTIIYFGIGKYQKQSVTCDFGYDEIIEHEWFMINEKNGNIRKSNYLYPDIKISNKYSRYRFDCSDNSCIVIWDSITGKGLFQVPLPPTSKGVITFDYSPIAKRFAAYQSNDLLSTWHWDSNEKLTDNNTCLECNYLKKSKDENGIDNYINYYCTNIDECYINCKSRPSSYMKKIPKLG